MIVKALLCAMFFHCSLAIAQSVAFFYGKHAPVTELCLYDNVIVDPNSDFNPQDYCDSMSTPFAYVSVGEVPKEAPYAKSIQPSWVIGKNAAWNNNLVLDETNSQWQGFFINQIIDPLWQKGYRGFFLDTLDSYVLAVHDPVLRQKQIDGVVSLIHQIKSRYPQAKIILNRGFQFLPQVHSDVYAVVIESLYHAWNQQKHEYEETPLTEQKWLLAEADKIKKMNLPVIIVDYLPPDQQAQAVELAKSIGQKGMIPWITNNSLDKIYIKKIHDVQREILVLFNNDNNFPTRFVPSFRFLGALLEYLGYIPKYININDTKKLPAENLQGKYAGIILWLDSIKATNVVVLEWAKRQISAQIPVVFLNSFGVPFETRQLKDFGLFFSPIKLSDVSLKVAKIDPDYAGLDTDPMISPYDFLPLRTTSSRILLQMKNEYQQTEDVVAITPWGGYALVPDVLFYMPNYYPLWIVDPINFLQGALRLNAFPVPVTTTENGRRIMTVHIDGDGFAYPANWLGGTFAGDELLQKVLKKYRIPTSVSVITGEIAPNGIHPDRSPELMKTARHIFELPWVEIASHTFSHPFYWQSSTRQNLGYLFGGEPFNINIPNYKFDLKTEINGSVDFINKYLAPRGKKCGLIFWSGLADPSVEALKLASDDNLLNINGESDTYIDNQFPSISGIRPMGAELGGYYQTFAPIDMDYYYIHGFAGPLYGYEHVIQTFQLTDMPRRFKPIDIYYHVYSTSIPASLQALNTVYGWALTQPVMNIYISDYIRKVIDYFKITLAYNDSSWLMYSGSELRELRSAKNAGYPDLARSVNVIGFRENKDDMYIHLGPMRLTVLKYQKDRPAQPYLVEANARVTAFSRNRNELVIKFQGYMPLQFTLANVAACKVTAQYKFRMTQNQNNTTSYSSEKDNNEIHIDC